VSVGATLPDGSAVHACLFDVFGTVVDWYGSVSRELSTFDVLHREGLEALVARHGIAGLSDDDLEHLTRSWHRLDPWPDAVGGLTRLKSCTVVAPCSNGNVSLLVAMAKRAGLPWDAVLGAEMVRTYKPQPEVYLASCRALDLDPGEVLMVAAHTLDLRAAKALGLRTAFVRRVDEFPTRQAVDAEPDPATDLIADDFGDLATQLGA
jgi:2-haloacid dehalogenase